MKETWSSVPSLIEGYLQLILASLLCGLLDLGRYFVFSITHTILAQRIVTAEWFFYWVSCLPSFKLKAGCNYSASFCGSAAIILLKESLVLIIFDFAYMRVKSLQIDMDNSEMALALQITCFVLKWLKALIYYKKYAGAFMYVWPIM